MKDNQKLVFPGTADGEYKFLKCPLLGELRCTLLCETVCADTGWADNKSKRVRSECESWKKYRELQQEEEDVENS